MAPSYSLTHLSDQTLLRDLTALVARDRTTTAALLAHVAEVDARKLYLPAGFPSMYLYCVHELHLSEEAARKRIHAARTARQFTAIFAALADGRLHLSAVILLAPYLSQENASQLLGAATHKTKFEIEQLIAERFPRLDVPVLVQALAEPPTARTMSSYERAPGRVDPPAPGSSESRAEVQPLAPERLALQLTIGQATHDKLRYAQERLSHQIPARDVAQVIDRALDALIIQLEKRKFAATDKPRPSHRSRATGNRYIPAEVKRAVWERDGGQCTFVSEAGRRCPSRTLLEFDHIDEVARGGEATVERMRLRCRAHNQYAAECAFGPEFMSKKREEARGMARAGAAAKAHARTAAGKARAQAAETERAKELDVIPWLRALGFRAEEARRRGHALRIHLRRPARAAGASGTVVPCPSRTRSSQCRRHGGDVIEARWGSLLHQPGVHDRALADRRRTLFPRL